MSLLLEIAEQKDVFITINHIVKFENITKALVINNNSAIITVDEYKQALRERRMGLI